MPSTTRRRRLTGKPPKQVPEGSDFCSGPFVLEAAGFVPKAKKRYGRGGILKNHLEATIIGMCFGAVFGLLLHNVLFGISIGAALGVAYERRHRNSL